MNMKKLIALVLVLTCVLALVGCSSETGEEKWDLIPMVMVNGVLYLDTGYGSTAAERYDAFDGEITSEVDGSEKPTVNDQSNFGTGYGYQYGQTEGTIEIYMNDKWRIFATEEVRQEIQFPKEEANHNNVVNIIDRTKTEDLPVDTAEEKFYVDEAAEYYFGGIMSHYVIVEYEDGSQKNVKEALAIGDITIEDLDRFDIGYLIESKKEQLTLEKAIELSAKGEELTWSDFEQYGYEDIGSGLYIYRYDIDENYYLLIGGYPQIEPMYIRLVSCENSDDYIDIRTESIDDFVNK